MIDCSALATQMEKSPLARWSAHLPAQLAACFSQRRHGDFDKWIQQVRDLPEIAAQNTELNRDTIRVTPAAAPPAGTLRQLESGLKQLHPWRKGPYEIHGVRIDSEWRSDWKWRRLQGEISPLRGRLVLDVGCGNGYHCWRSAGAGAALVIGIDPTQLFLAQFLALKRYLGNQLPVHLLPLAIEDVPPALRAFDTVFSMGVLYHRRSPLDHLLELRDCLRPGGELVLETLVIEGAVGCVLLPSGRYAKMRNVWFIPSPQTLSGWLQRCGFRDVRIVDVCTTTTDEQRATEWMKFESLADYLDPSDQSRTKEGHPAPRRAILTAASR